MPSFQSSKFNPLTQHQIKRYYSGLIEPQQDGLGSSPPTSTSCQFLSLRRILLWIFTKLYR